MTQPARLLVVGCGYVGSQLGLIMARKGLRVTGLRRNPSHLPEGIDRLAVDLMSDPQLAQVQTDYDYVVYTVSANGFSEEAYRTAYVNALGRLLERFPTDKPTRFVFVSSTGVYGQSEGEWVTEQSATMPSGFSGETVLEGERLVQSSGLNYLIVRLGGIYGPGRTRLIDSVRDGTARLTPRAVYTNRIHRDDAAGAIAYLLESVGPLDSRSQSPRIFNLVDSEPALSNDVLSWLAARLGLELETGEQASSRQRGHKRCSNELLLGSGYRLHYPTFREGYSSLL